MTMNQHTGTLAKNISADLSLRNTINLGVSIVLNLNIGHELASAPFQILTRP
jgi:hypothetical protein